MWSSALDSSDTNSIAHNHHTDIYSQTYLFILILILMKVVTHTTRSPRIDEIDGVSYHFVTKAAYDEMLKNGDFLENAQVHNNFYGISHSAVDNVMNRHKIPILEIDIQGTRSINGGIASDKGWEPRCVFISPQSIDMLRERLEIRGTETEEEIQLRIKNAEIELEIVESESESERLRARTTESGQEKEKERLFDQVLVNDDFEKTVNTFFRLMRDWYPQLPSPTRIRMLQRKIAKLRAMEEEKIL